MLIATLLAMHSSPEQTDPQASAAKTNTPATGVTSVSLSDVFVSQLTPAECHAELHAASRRGKLPGFVAAPDLHATSLSCSADQFGQPYDRTLYIHLNATDAGGTQITFTSQLKRKLPIVVCCVMAFALWPGVTLTHSLLVTYFGWYPRADWITWAWYMPLTLLAVPALLGQYKKSERLAAEEAHATIAKIATWTNASPR